MKRERQLFAISVATVAALTFLVGSASADVVCAPDPLSVAGCKAAAKSKLGIHDDPSVGDGAEDTLSWAWLRGQPLPANGLGNPMIDTEYALCIYDGNDGVHELVKEHQIPAGASYWEVKGQNGFQYSDRTMLSDGIFLVRLKADTVADGKSLVKLKGRGVLLDPPGPPDDLPLQYFEQNPSVIVHLVNSVGTCWVTEYLIGDNRKVTSKDYRATTHD